MAKQKRRGHGEGSIYYREGEKRWVASFVLENGKRKYLTGKTQKEALEKLRKAQREYEQGMLATGTRQTVKQYLEYWLEDVHKSRIRLSTYVEYRLMLDKHILPALGQMQLQRLTSEQVEALYARKREEGLSPGSIRNIHTVLHKALEHAVRRSRVARNVCDSVELPRYSRGEARILTKEQAKLLLEQARGHQMEAILTLAVTTGMRRGELLGLHWQDIDFERGSLQVRRTMNRISGHGLRETEPKTAQSRRNIVLPQFVVEVLKEHRARQREECLQAGDAWKDHDLVFSTRRGGFLDPTYLLERFQKLLDEASLPHMRFHELRHSAATMLLSMGINAKVVQELLGHSTISMTLGTYSHVLPGMQRDAMDGLDDFFRE